MENNNNISSQIEMFTCPMHNEILSDNPGKCPKCGMTLLKQLLTADQHQLLKNGNYTKP